MADDPALKLRILHAIMRMPYEERLPWTLAVVRATPEERRAMVDAHIGPLRPSLTVIDGAAATRAAVQPDDPSVD